MWVKAHDGIPENEYADYKAKETGSIGRLLNQRQIATTAGIRATFHSNRLSKQLKTWDRNAVRGLTYKVTDRGPLKSWLHTIGKAEENKCKCTSGREVQNAAHLRTKEEAMEDPEWCMAVWEFLQEQEV